MPLFHISAYVSFVSMQTVVCFLRLSSDYNLNHADNVFVDLKAGERTKRSADNVFHPETYDLDFSVENIQLHLHLSRNDEISTNIPSIILNHGSMQSFNEPDDVNSLFYQDAYSGAVFAVQEDSTYTQSMFGVFHLNGDEYILQTPEDNQYLILGHNKFQIIKEERLNISFDRILKTDVTGSVMQEIRHHRRKRATGDYKIELLVVADFSIYQYWLNNSQKATAEEKAADALQTVRQFYAFVINGMDAMYKNIQTSSYTISIVFAGIIIAQTTSDSPWTETIKVTTVNPNQVDSSNALSSFRTWIQSESNLPDFDHAMLFTRYDLTSGGSTSNAGLAYLGAVCTSSSQSIVEDGFNFIILTVAAHELGHSLNSSHDGENGNSCYLSDRYIMAASSGAQSGSIATNPWKFSSCSTSYFTAYIDSLETLGTNCMSTLGASFNASALAEYENMKPGQVYDADLQCEHIQGSGSYFCRDRYSGDFSTICTTLWCSIPSNPGYCSTAVAADGTLCGNQKWCITGVCTYDSQAPSGQSSCLYGDTKGQIFSNQPWNCSDIANDVPSVCPNVPLKCCDSCAPYLPSTTSVSTTSSASGATTGHGSVTLSSSYENSTTSVFETTTFSTQYDVDARCSSLAGNGSYMCRNPYGGDYTSICTTLWCADPTNTSMCLSKTVLDGTLCGNQKWCISGTCTHDSNAPQGDDSCLYGDRVGAVFTNGWTCADMVSNAPQYCSVVPVDCCGSCSQETTTTTVTDTTTLILTSASTSLITDSTTLSSTQTTASQATVATTAHSTGITTSQTTHTTLSTTVIATSPTTHTTISPTIHTTMSPTTHTATTSPTTHTAISPTTHTTMSQTTHTSTSTTHTTISSTTHTAISPTTDASTSPTTDTPTSSMTDATTASTTDTGSSSSLVDTTTTSATDTQTSPSTDTISSTTTDAPTSTMTSTSTSPTTETPTSHMTDSTTQPTTYLTTLSSTATHTSSATSTTKSSTADTTTSPATQTTSSDLGFGSGSVPVFKRGTMYTVIALAFVLVI